jgi:hypothetical protein
MAMPHLAKELIGWQNETPLKEGLQKMQKLAEDYSMPLYEKKAGAG